MSGESLEEYFRLNFALMYKLQKSRFTLTELENMLPYERDIYVSMIMQDLREEIERKQNNG